MKTKSFGKSILVNSAAVLMIIGVAALMIPGSSAIAEHGGPTFEGAGDIWGDDLGPCEELGFSKDLRVTIELNQRERELIHLAMDSFIVDLEHEKSGIDKAPVDETYPLPFETRSFFLGYFIDHVVPTIQARVKAAQVPDFPSPENEAAMKASIQEIEFTGCERIGLSIATEKWSVKDGGQSQRHIALCEKSPEMNQTTGCDSFRPLGEAYTTLSKKIETDQK